MLSSSFFYSCNSQVSGEEQFQADLKSIDNYLDAQHLTYFKDVSGIRFTITSLGTAGLPPRRDHSVTVKYTARQFTSGVSFEQTTVTDTLKTLYPSGLIEGLEILPEGTYATLYLPSALGFGTQTVNNIPPNSILVYEVQLFDVTPSARETQQLTQDIAAMDQYLTANSITALTAPFGVKYVITSSQSGQVPGWYNKVRVSYKGVVMSDGSTFFNGTVEPTAGFDSRVIDYIQGLQVAFQVLPVGSKGTFYIPSVLGFGNQGAKKDNVTLVPANANIIYEITTLELAN